MSLLPTIGAVDQDTGFYNSAITKAVRFPAVGGGYLSRTFDNNNTGNDWTFSTWIKRSVIDQHLAIFYSSSTSNPYYQAGMAFNSSNQLWYYGFSNANAFYGSFTSTAVFRDTSAWYHVVLQRDQNGNSTYYVNGTQVAQASSNGTHNYINGTSYPHYIGNYTYQSNAGGWFHGYMAETIFVDNALVAPTVFAETKEGVWIAKEDPDVTYGDNGFRLQYLQSGTSQNSSGIGADTSGNDNHFAVTSLTAHDVVPDSPENNFCTLNPLSKQTYTFAEGNLKLSRASGTAQSAAVGTFSVKSGKWYWEVRLVSGQSNYPRIGIFNTELGNNHIETAYPANNDLGARVWGSAANGATNKIFGDSNTEAAFGSYDDGDVVQFALDMDNFKMYMGKGDTWYTNSSTTTDKANISDSSANAAFDAATNLDIVAGNSFAPLIFGNANADVWIANFGQDSTFAGGIDAGSGSDANGIGNFKYAPPSGYLALCSANLPEPTIGPNSTSQSDDHFNTVIHTSVNEAASIDVGFKPDWIWAKSRNRVSTHILVDSTRGVRKYVSSHDPFVEIDSNSENSVDILAFTSTGFDVPDDPHGYFNYHNGSSTLDNNVFWCWKANGGTTTTNDASSTSVGTIDSVFQANTTSGFSIVTYTGTGSAGTIAHGLGAVPKMIMVRNRDATDAWAVYHAAVSSDPETDYLTLNENYAVADHNTVWNDTAPTSTVFSVGTADSVNTSGEKILAYLFAEVEGYSKFGSYTSNNEASNNAFVYTGFRPAFLLVKMTPSTTEWVMMDNKKSSSSGGNPIDRGQYPHLSNTEYSGQKVDFLSNGFKVRDTSGVGYSTRNVIYMAFAEVPFKYANAR